MRFEQKPRKKERPLYLLSYRRNGKGAWIEGIPVYDRSVVRRDKAFYASLHGAENVRVEVIDKMGRRRRPEFGDGDEE